MFPLYLDCKLKKKVDELHNDLFIIQLLIFSYGLQGPRQDSYRYAVTPDESKKKGKKGKKADMDELKQELTMDEHKIPITELYSRLNTDPNMV